MLSPGKVTKKKGMVMDKRKLWHKRQNSRITQKSRRLLLKVSACTWNHALSFWNCFPKIRKTDVENKCKNLIVNWYSGVRLIQHDVH